MPCLPEFSQLFPKHLNREFIPENREFTSYNKDSTRAVLRSGILCSAIGLAKIARVFVAHETRPM